MVDWASPALSVGKGEVIVLRSTLANTIFISAVVFSELERGRVDLLRPGAPSPACREDIDLGGFDLGGREVAGGFMLGRAKLDLCMLVGSGSLLR